MCNSWLLLIIALTVVCLWNSQQTETSKSCPAECICLSQTQVSLTMSVEPPTPLPLTSSPSLSPSPNPPFYSTCSSASCLHCAASSSSASVETWPAPAARRVCDLLLPCKLIKPQVTQLLLMRCCSNLQCTFCI